jgi:hypothetical protein
MDWYLLVVSVLVPITVSMAIGYVVLQRTVGRETTHRGLKRAAPIMLFFIILAVTISFIAGGHFTYLVIGFGFILALLLCLWMITWKERKNKAGTLILNIGKLPTSRAYFRVGVLNGVVSGFITFLAIYQISIARTISVIELQSISQAILSWSMAIYFILLGLSKLEFRENGICYMLSLLKWDNLAAYRWNKEKLNILTIRFKQPRFFLSSKFWSVEIPSQNRDAVERILELHLIKSNTM